MKLIDNWIKFFQYLLKNYWTKKEIAQQIANIEKLGIQVVQSLPSAQSGKDFTVYLVPIQGDTNNVYQEYLRINGAWELIGTTAVNLSNYLPLSGTQFNANDSFTITTSTGKQFVYFDDRNNGKSSIYFGNPNSTYDLQFLQINAAQIRLDSPFIMHNNHSQNTPNGFVIQNSNGVIIGQKASQNSITTIPSATSAYTLSIGEFNHTPDSAVTYTLPTATSGYSNEIVLQVSFANTTSITFNGTYEYDRTLTPETDDVVIYLIRYSELKNKWIIYPMI